MPFNFVELFGVFLFLIMFLFIGDLMIFCGATGGTFDCHIAGLSLPLDLLS